MIQFLTYAAVGIFVVAVIVRVKHWAGSSFHLRWEIYPDCREKSKEYGGSYYEELNWWERPRSHYFMGALKYMLIETLLMRGLWKNQRKLWRASFPFHLGLYLLCVFLVLLFAGAVLEAAGINVSRSSSNPFIILIVYLTTITGFAGLILGLAGAVGLLFMRATAENLRLYSSAVDYFTLGFFIVLFTAWLLTCITGGEMRDFSQARNYLEKMITFQATGYPGLSFSLSLILLDLMLIYAPFTRMLHPLAKYFFYYKVKWDDIPNVPGGTIERKVERALRRPVMWSAPHIRGDGSKTWKKAVDEEVQ